MYCLSENFKVTRLQNAVVGLDIQKGEYYILNDVAQIVFENLLKEKVFQKKKIVLEILSRYIVDLEKVEEDLDDFINHILEKGWIFEESYELNEKVRVLHSGNYTYYYSCLDHSYYGMEGVGNWVIEEICNGKNIKQIILDVAKQYNQKIECVQEDILDYLNELVEKGILVNRTKA